MSIYPVHLASWYPRREAYRPVIGYDLTLHQNAKALVKSARCESCGKRCKWNRAVGHHSIPWGYGEIWCSEKCCFGERK